MLPSRRLLLIIVIAFDHRHTVGYVANNKQYRAVHSRQNETNTTFSVNKNYQYIPIVPCGYNLPVLLLVFNTVLKIVLVRLRIWFVCGLGMVRVFEQNMMGQYQKRYSEVGGEQGGSQHMGGVSAGLGVQ